MRGNIAPHDIIYYYLIASARKILFSLFQAGTCRPPSALSAAAGHPSAYDLRTHAATPPRVPCPTAPAPMARGQPRHQSPARRHAMRMAIPPPIRLPRPVPAVAAPLLPLRCAQIGPRSRGHLYITCSQWPTVAGSNVFFWPNLGARSGAHALAVSRLFVAGIYRTAIACGCGRVGRGCVGTWPQRVVERVALM